MLSRKQLPRCEQIDTEDPRSIATSRGRDGPVAGGERTCDIRFVAGLWAIPISGRGMQHILYRHAKGSFHIQRFPEGLVIPSKYFQAIIQRELERLNCITWVNDNVMCRAYSDYLLHAWDTILGRLERLDSCAAAHGCMLHDISIK